MFASTVTDNEWKITAYDGGTGGLATVVPNPANSYYALPSTSAQWVIPAKNVSAGGNYTYRYNFTVAPGVEAKLKFRRIGADDDLVLNIDGNAPIFSSTSGGTTGWAFKEDRVILKKCLETAQLTAGSHYIECIVNNYGASGSPTGLLIEGCMDLVKVEPPRPPFEDTKCCTGNAVNLSTGFTNASNSMTALNSIEDDWKLISTPNSTGGIMSVAGDNPSWATPSSKAGWVVPSKNNQEVGVHVYEYKLVVPLGKAANIKISRIGGDNDVKLTAGTNTYISNSGAMGYTYKKAILPKCFEVQLPAGTHIIRAEVTNIEAVSGLLVEGCYDLIDVQPVCRCPEGWVSNTTNKEGDITTDGNCKKKVCGPMNIKPLPKNGTAIGTWGFTWGDDIWVVGTKENGGAAVCK